METKLTEPTMMTSAQLEFITGGIKKRPRPAQRDEHERPHWMSPMGAGSLRVLGGWSTSSAVALVTGLTVGV